MKKIIIEVTELDAWEMMLKNENGDEIYLDTKKNNKLRDFLRGSKMAKKITYWYCPECDRELCDENVTYEELHDDCGHEVEVKEYIELKGVDK